MTPFLPQGLCTSWSCLIEHTLNRFCTTSLSQLSGLILNVTLLVMTDLTDHVRAVPTPLPRLQTLCSSFYTHGSPLPCDLPHQAIQEGYVICVQTFLSFVTEVLWLPHRRQSSKGTPDSVPRCGESARSQPGLTDMQGAVDGTEGPKQPALRA